MQYGQAQVQPQHPQAQPARKVDSLNLPFAHRRSRHRVYVVKKKHRTDINADAWAVQGYAAKQQ